MSDIDLMPEDYRRNLQLVQCLKIFAINTAVALIILLVTYLVVHYQLNSLVSDIEQLQEQKAFNARQSAELAKLGDQKTQLQQQWELLSSLRSGAPAENMFQMIDRSLVETDVWFTSWKFYRAGVLIEQPPAGVNSGYFIVVPKDELSAKPGTLQVQTHMAIQGEARDHSALSSFVKRLFQQPEVYDVNVLKTSLQQRSAIEVIAFELTIIVNSIVEPEQ